MMKPVKFKEANIELRKPDSMGEEECSSLWVCKTSEEQCVSKWKIPLKDRIRLLFHGTIWLGVLSGGTQPPVWLNAKKTIFEKKKEKKQEKGNTK